MKSAGKARNNGLYRHIRTSKEIIRNLLNDFLKYTKYSCEKLPFFDDKSLAESSLSIYAVLPFLFS